MAPEKELRSRLILSSGFLCRVLYAWANIQLRAICHKRQTVMDYENIPKRQNTKVLFISDGQLHSIQPNKIPHTKTK